MRGDIEVLHNGEKIRVMQPEKRTYNASGMTMTEPAIDTGFIRDLYVALGSLWRMVLGSFGYTTSPLLTGSGLVAC